MYTTPFHSLADGKFSPVPLFPPDQYLFFWVFFLADCVARLPFFSSLLPTQVLPRATGV